MYDTNIPTILGWEYGQIEQPFTRTRLRTIVEISAPHGEMLSIAIVRWVMFCFSVIYVIYGRFPQHTGDISYSTVLISIRGDAKMSNGGLMDLG